MNFSLFHFLTISSNLAHRQLPNENLYLVSQGVNFPNKKWSQPTLCGLAPYDDFKGCVHYIFASLFYVSKREHL